MKCASYNINWTPKPDWTPNCGRNMTKKKLSTKNKSRIAGSTNSATVIVNVKWNGYLPHRSTQAPVRASYGLDVKCSRTWEWTWMIWSSKKSLTMTSIEVTATPGAMDRSISPRNASGSQTNIKAAPKCSPRSKKNLCRSLTRIFPWKLSIRRCGANTQRFGTWYNFQSTHVQRPVAKFSPPKNKSKLSMQQIFNSSEYQDDAKVKERTESSQSKRLTMSTPQLPPTP